MPANFEFTGLDQFVQRLQAWGDDVLQAADSAVEEAAADAASGARAAVPVRSGDLQRSIESERVSWGLAKVEVGEGAPYARVVNARTGFFSRPVDTVQRELRERVSSAIGKAVFG